MKRFLGMVTTTLVLIFGTSCSSDSSDDGTSEENAGQLELDLTDNPLLESYPSSLNVNVLPTDTSTEGAVTTGALELGDAVGLTAPFHLYPKLELNLNECTNNPNGDEQSKCFCSHRDQVKLDPLRQIDGKPPVARPIADIAFKNGLEKTSGKERRSAQKQRSKGEGKCFDVDFDKTFDLIVKTAGGDLPQEEQFYCYEFDWGLESGYPTNLDGEELKDADACLVAFSRNEVDLVQAYVDFANLMQLGMLCESKKASSVEKLDENSEKSLTDILQKADTGTIEFVSAEIKREANRDDKPVFLTTVEFKKSCPDCEEGITAKFNIKHNPLDENNTKYRGVVWGTMTNPVQKNNNVKDKLTLTQDNPEPGPDTNKSRFFSVRYESSLEGEQGITRVNYDALTASMRTDFFTGENDPFDANGTLDLNKGANEQGKFGTDMDSHNKYLEQMKYVVVNGYPTERVYNFSYWRNPGENYNENARGFEFFINRDEENKTYGCGIAGAASVGQVASQDGYSIRRALKEDADLKVQGYLRPFQCPRSMGNVDFGTKTWRQCFYQDESGRYIADTSKHEGGGDFEFIGVDDEKVSGRPKAKRPTNPF